MSEELKKEDQNNNFNPLSFFAMKESEPVQFIEKRDKDYVLFGKDNLFPEEIKNLSLQSTYHSSILKTKSDMIGGQGFVNELNDKKIDDFIDNKHGDLDMESILHKIAQDLVIFNAFALYIQWTKDGGRIASIDYVDVSEIRVSKERDNNGLRTFFHSPDWSRPKREENKPVEYQEFSPEHTKQREQIMYIKEPSIFNTKYYALPEYYAAWNYINLENKLSEFKLNYIENGFFAGAHIDLKVNPSPEQKDEIVKEIKKQAQSHHNAGRMMVTFSEDDSKKTEFKPIEPQFPDDFFEQTQDEIVQAILAQHHITNPQILGIRVPGELGGSDDLQRDIEQFYHLAVKPKERIIEKALNNLFTYSFKSLEDQVIELEKYNDFVNMDKSKNDDKEAPQEDGGEEVDNENKPESE